MSTENRSMQADAGLFRTRLAGRHARTREAFDVLRQRVRPLIMGAGRDPIGLYGERLCVSDAQSEGHWELISLRDEIFLILSDCHYSAPRTESVLPEGFVEFHFMLQGPVSVDISDVGQIQIGAPNLTVVHQGDDMHYHVSCGAGVWRSVALYVSRAWFDRFVVEAMGEGNALSRDLDSVANDHVLCRQMPLGMQTFTAVEQLLSNPFHGARRLLFAQAKVMEIMCGSLDLWQQFIQSDRVADVFSARDLRLIEKARDLLLNDLTRSPTIPELARAVGTNTSKLKRGFKFLYGMTIFEYGHRQRMSEALRLLIEDRLAVNQVASSVGYQHQTSFTASFREHFGFTPKDARRMASSEALRSRLGGDTWSLPDAGMRIG